MGSEVKVVSHRYQDVIDIFARCFLQSEQTLLVAGDSEPFYVPAGAFPPEQAQWLQAQGVTEQAYHRIFFAHGFYASALHEIAHWCIAGAQRRQQFDYGYWYAPDGRDAAQQAAFEQVERKPQALEWLFADAAQFEFQVSVDNLSGIEVDRQAFTAQVAAQKQRYLQQGLPARAAQFRAALAAFYQTPVGAANDDLITPKALVKG